MERIIDLLLLTMSALVALSGREPKALFFILAFALASGALSWMVLSHSALLWNRSFATKAARHPLCGLAALSTLLVVPLCVGASYTRPVVNRAIAQWTRDVLASPRWQKIALAQAGKNIRRKGLEPFLPPPEEAFLPLTTAAAREAAAAAYATTAVASFASVYPLLAGILGLSAAAPAKELSADMKRFFDSSPGLYPEGRIEWVIGDFLIERTNQCWGDLVRQTQISLALLLLLFHLAVFGIVGWAGYREIRTGLEQAKP
ncbi:MAG: hypothetical protein AB7T14_04445 [Candidatus Methylacidiphilaceae bacterium]